MIILTRLGGQQMALNPDLIERAEPTPDTVITMVDGHKLVVAESLADVVARVRSWRAGVAAEAFALCRDGAALPAGHDVDDLEELAAHDTTAHSPMQSPVGDSLPARVLRMHRREG